MAETLPQRIKLQRGDTSYMSIPRPGALLTGKQEHYLKRELISQEAKFEINDLSSPTALRRFGAPFKGDKGEVSPQDSELPLLRYLFVHHVRTFPFLDQAREREFWQDRVQVFLESFAGKQISSSEDRLEETKRKKLARKAEKLVEIMMVSGIPTASGYEERIRFAEMEVVDRGAQEHGLVVNTPEGHPINGWDVNVAGVRMISVKKRFRSQHEGEYIIRVKTNDQPEHYVVRRYEDFKTMHDLLRVELAGKVLPPLPKKNSADYVMPSFMNDSDSLSSTSSDDTIPQEKPTHVGALKEYLSSDNANEKLGRNHFPSSDSASSIYLDAPESPEADKLKPAGFRDRVKHKVHKRKTSSASALSIRPPGSPRASVDNTQPPVLFREAQRVSLRAALRTLLQNQHIARSKSMQDFLLKDKVELSDFELADIGRRKVVDEKRIEEQRQFYEIASKRAAEVDVHMEKFRRDIIETSKGYHFIDDNQLRDEATVQLLTVKDGLRKLFSSIKQKNTIAELPPEHKKVAEWLRIEIAATIYHLFLAEDNSAELFSQLKRIHSLFPYTVIKNIVRFANPLVLFPRVLDVLMAQPFGSRSLLQHIFGMAIQDGVNNIGKSITVLTTHKIQEPDFPEKIHKYVDADEDVKSAIKEEARQKNIDIVFAILQSDKVGDVLAHDQLALAEDAHTSWKRAVENVGSERTANAELYAHMKQLLKLYLRLRDKVKMLEIINEVRRLPNFPPSAGIIKLFIVLLADEKCFFAADMIIHLWKTQASEKIQAASYGSDLPCIASKKFPTQQYLCLFNVMINDVDHWQPNTIKLLRNLLEIFYEPIMRVIKSANVYSSVTDLASFVTDIIKTVEEAQRQGFSADPNQTVQAFIDLCARHEDDFYKFVHEMHKHDNGLFDALMGHIEAILDFLRHGPKGGALDMNGLIQDAIDSATIDTTKAIREINALIKWQIKRKRWHQDKTRRKMASGGDEYSSSMPGFNTIRPSDFGVEEEDLSDLEDDGDEWSGSESDEDEDDNDGILAEQKRRARQARLRSGAGEPSKPPIEELSKLMPGFLDRLRGVLAE